MNFAPAAIGHQPGDLATTPIANFSNSSTQMPDRDDYPTEDELTIARHFLRDELHATSLEIVAIKLENKSLILRLHGLVCSVCNTNSWEPSEEGMMFTIPDDNGGWMRCSYCYLTYQLKMQLTEVVRPSPMPMIDERWITAGARWILAGASDWAGKAGEPSINSDRDPDAWKGGT